MAPLLTHVTEESWFFCKFCGRSYLNAEKYNAHLEEHEKEGEDIDSEDEPLINYKRRSESASPDPDAPRNSFCKICNICIRNTRKRR